MRVPAPAACAAVPELVGRTLLRDGSAVVVRISRAEDVPAVNAFFHTLSAADRYQRFLSASEPAPSAVAALCDSTDRSKALTLVAELERGGTGRIVGVASYQRANERDAEVAFAVDSRLHGRGIATALLERLAASAAEHGFARLRALTLADNAAMLEVFADSGLPMTTVTDGGTTDVVLTLTASDARAAVVDAREQRAEGASIARLLRPQSVAVIGASRSTSHLGRRVLDAIVAAGFAGPVYPVNPTATDIAGLPCHPRAAALPDGVDLAVIAVPADRVLEAVDDCAAAGIGSLVVITAGFSEVGDAGRARQEALEARVRAHGMRMLGPNCMGFLNTTIALNASFSPIMPPRGAVAFSSQSGALGLAILELARDREIGLSTFVSIGNKADVSSNDLLQYWDTDPDTSVILLYLESFGNPRKFARLARRIGARKPIVAVKAGRTRAGSRAAGSHTAALAADDAIVDELFRATGVVRADTIDELFDIASLFASQPLPRGRRVGIVTNGGGPGILAVDACERSGLIVGGLSLATHARLASFLSSSASVGNPVDMIASAGAEEFRQTIETLLAAEEIDAVIVIYVPVDLTQVGKINDGIVRGIASARAAGHLKPVMACVMAGRMGPQPLRVGDERIPAYAFPENAARALAKAAVYAEWRTTPSGRAWTFDDARPDEARTLCAQVVAARGEDWLTPEELQRLLGAYGLPLVHGALARDPDEAARISGVMATPVVAKLVARDLVHKTEAGGVRVGLRGPDDVRAAAAELLAMSRDRGLHADGVLLQPMTSGVETLVGVTQDPLFGPVVGFGLGGTEVELERDAHFRPAPLTDRDADDLIRESRAYPRLTGFRGRPKADVTALADLLLRVSQLATDVPQVLEVDFNPVMALPDGHGCAIVDARVRVGTPRRANRA